MINYSFYNSNSSNFKAIYSRNLHCVLYKYSAYKAAACFCLNNATEPKLNINKPKITIPHCDRVGTVFFLVEKVNLQGNGASIVYHALSTPS